MHPDGILPSMRENMSNDHTLFLYGNDEFAIARRLSEIQAQHDADGLNTARIEARTVSQEELNNAINAMPFLSAMRLVFLANPSARTSAPSARQKFLDFLLAAPPSTLVVLHELVEPREISKHWLVKRAEKGELKAEAFMMPRLQEMPGWIINETRRQNGQMEAGAASLLAEMTGEDTRLATQEITKLLTYVNFTRPIRLTDVEAVSIVSAQVDVFSLVDALGSGDGKKAQKVLHQLLENEEPFGLWGMVIRQFRLLLQAKEILDQGGKEFNVQQTLGLHGFVAGKICTQARRFQLTSLEAIYHKLLEIDEGAKTSQVTLDLALDMLVMELTH
jgi:DNA polymerase-3 subunit delta